MDIHIFWEGPFSLIEVREKDADKDYGVYQIYGHHPLYGSNVLLYIGKAQAQTFALRISQEKWVERTDPINTQIYLGRLAGKNKISGDAWEELIQQAEQLLIYAHLPALNTQNTKSLSEEKVLGNRIFNWDSHRDLFPEVSGSRFTSRYEHIGAEHIYDESRIL